MNLLRHEKALIYQCFCVINIGFDSRTLLQYNIPAFSASIIICADEKAAGFGLSLFLPLGCRQRMDSLAGVESGVGCSSVHGLIEGGGGVANIII